MLSAKAQYSIWALVPTNIIINSLIIIFIDVSLINFANILFDIYSLYGNHHIQSFVSL